MLLRVLQVYQAPKMQKAILPRVANMWQDAFRRFGSRKKQRFLCREARYSPIRCLCTHVSKLIPKPRPTFLPTHSVDHGSQGTQTHQSIAQLLRSHSDNAYRNFFVSPALRRHHRIRSRKLNAQQTVRRRPITRKRHRMSAAMTHDRISHEGSRGTRRKGAIRESAMAWEP